VVLSKKITKGELCMIACQILNAEEEVISYVNLCDNDSFVSLSEFLWGHGYMLEQIAQ
jgi:hypothetical protein